MTYSSRKILLCLLAATIPALALAQTQPVKPAAPAPRPRTVVVTPSAATQQYQRQVDRQQLQNRQNQNALREQLRQNNVDMQRANATDPALRNQLDNADRSDQQLYRARQDAAVQRFQTEQRPGTTNTPPARSSSTGH